MRALTLLALAISVCACGGGSPGTPTAPPTLPAGDLTTRLSNAFDGYAIPSGAGCSISITRNGQVLLERGRGQVAPGRVADAESLYRIASLTKPITAAAVLVSEAAGRLSRTDKINRFVAYPEPAPTIDELIKHVPGLPDYVTFPSNTSGSSSPTSLESLLSLIPPWDGVRRNQYSSSHYVLLGAALHQANGVRYQDVVQRDIFGPAGMTRTSFSLAPASETAGFPVAFRTDPTWSYAAGAFTSTVREMTLFNQALLNNQFGFGTLESFDRSGGIISLGMGVSAPNGDLRFTHAGLIDNYGSFTVIYPADRTSVVVLCNFFNSTLPNFVMGPNGIRAIMLGQ